jgi:hypothetical protein
LIKIPLTLLNRSEKLLYTSGGWWGELYDDRLFVMAGMALMERSQTHGNHV